MKSIRITLIGLLLAGCQTSSIAPEGESAPVVVVPVEEAPDVADWLARRSELCVLDTEDQRIQLRQPPAETEAGRLEQVLLASCQPEYTPGLLREALSALSPDQYTDQAVQDLLQLLQDHARSYRILEERNAQLAAQLEATIDGIRQIEADMDGLRRNRRNP